MVDASQPGDPTTIGKIAAQYPAPVILNGVNTENLSEMIAVMASMPNLMVETHELHVPGGLEVIAAKVGTERIIFGSGAPRRSMASSLHYILDSYFPDEDKQLMLSGNLKRALGVG
jgi:predicted TIM-barrel fold metal-dependent hydrolase